jgi:hypothetical protein
MRYEIRPLVAWTDPETSPRRGAHVFRASWRDTLVMLGDEIERIGGQPPVVFQIDVTEGDIRLDGMLRANAKAGHPGVVVSFLSDFGPLRYATDAYERQWGHGMDSWQANIRAIALTLEALRSIDRWGVSKRGEQYTGWKALPASTGTTFPSADEALRWMRSRAADLCDVPAEAVEVTLPPRDCYRLLARRWHPDTPTADPDEWERLSNARTLLTTAGML